MSSSGLSRATEDFIIYLINAADEGILHTVRSSSVKIQRAGRQWLRVDYSPVWLNLYTDSALRPWSLGVVLDTGNASSSCFNLK